MPESASKKTKSATNAEIKTTKAPRKRKSNVEARHEDKKLLILTTAAELFATLGYEVTSLDLIAEHVGIHKATLYHYISNKESILYECLQLSFKDLNAIMDEMKNTDICVFVRLRKFTLSLALAQNNIFGRCLSIVGPRPLGKESSEEIKNFQDNLDHIVRDLIAEGVKDGKIKPCAPSLVSAMLFGAFTWVPRWYKEDGKLSLEEIANLYTDILIDGVRAS